MKFGNWYISETLIEWKGEGSNSFIIDRKLLLETIGVGATEQPLYKWIMAATEQEWLTEDDLYDLNFAFAFAAGAVPETFKYEIFDSTLEYQFNNLEEEDDDDEL